MGEFRERGRRKFMISKTAAFFVVLISLFVVYSFARAYLKNREASKRDLAVNAQINELQQKKAELEKEIARLKTNEGIEEEVRKKFDVAKPDEEMVVIVEKEETGDEEQEKEIGFFGKIWEKIKGIF